MITFSENAGASYMIDTRRFSIFNPICFHLAKFSVASVGFHQSRKKIVAFVFNARALVVRFIILN